MKLLVKSLLVITIITLASPSATSVAVELPSIGDTSELYLSQQEDQRLGEAFMRNIRQTLKIIDDPEIETYIQTLGYRLVSNSDSQNKNFGFFIVDDSTINAFAGPGGYIGVNTGLILITESESELASVIAHEIAHVTQRHLARQFEAISKRSLPATAAVIAAIILGNKGGGQLGEAAIAATAAGNIQSQINFTRTNEQEADRVGLQLLADSGFNPRSMPVFFERLQHATQAYENAQLEFLRTHPVTLSRIADTRNRAEQYPVNTDFDETTYFLMQAKLRVLSDNNPQQSIDYYKGLLDDKRGNEDANRYGYVLALQAAGKYDAARTQITKLIGKYPERIAYQIALARIETADNHPEKGLEIYKRNLEIYPHNHPLTMYYAALLLQQKMPEQARNLLVEQSRFKTPTPPIYKMLAQAENNAGHPAEAHIAQAEYYYLTGQTHEAIEQLNIALRNVSEENTNQKARINARLKQFKDEVKQEGKE